MSSWVVIHAVSTWFLTGLIWTVQVVHYPLFAGVGHDRFREFHADHARRIGRLVVPMMPLEALAAVVLALRPPDGVAPAAAWLGVALVGVVWLSTAAVQIPQHRRLSRGFDPAVHRFLVRGNGIRTAAWSARALLAGSFLLA